MRKNHLLSADKTNFRREGLQNMGMHIKTSYSGVNETYQMMSNQGSIAH